MAFIKRQLESFEDINRLINTLNGDFVDFEKNVKILAKKESELKAIIALQENYTKNEIAFVNSLIRQVEFILDPIYEKIIDKAFKHYLEWFGVVSSDNDSEIELAKTQMKMVYWMFYRIIRKKSLKDIYTVVMPRGGGKSYIIASIAVFLMNYHDRYLINKKDNRYVILITSPSDNNLTQFLSYARDFVDRSFNRVENEGVELARNNDELVRLKKDNIVFSEVFFRLAGRNAKNIEGVHADLLLADEFKMVEKPNWDTSILPCLNGRAGLPVCISSTDEYYTFFQEICEKNINLEKIDGEMRHFQGDVYKLALERPDYALTVARARDQLGENSIAFRTQYKCEFIGKKKQGFFDFDALNELGIFVEKFNDRKYAHNRNYVIVAGWDYAPISDNSMFTIKAVEEGYGQLRRTHMILQTVLNTERNVQINDIRSQIREAISLIKEYNIQALCIDAGGAGANLKNLLVEELMDRNDVEIDYSLITEIKFSQQSRIDILDNYSNRINSGLEFLFEVPDISTHIEDMKRYYNNTIDNFEDDSEIVRFIYEHCRFTKTTEQNNDGKIKTIYRQALDYKLKDDTIFSSCLASHNLVICPSITYLETNTIYGDFHSENVSTYGI